MATVTTTRKITADEFMNMDLGEGLYELVDGEIIEVAPPEYSHGYVCGNAAFAFMNYARTTGHGHAATNDSMVKIDAFNVRGADVSYYSEARWPKQRIGKERPPVPPDLVVEVLSPGDRPARFLRKVANYLDAGVAIVLALNPAKKSLTIYRGDADSDTLHEFDTLENLPELPGFRCPVSEFFA